MSSSKAAVLGSDASRSSEAADAAALSRHVAFPSSDSASRKRKRDGPTMEDLLKPAILVKPHGGGILSAAPRTLSPMMLLPRERLPLSCLDLTCPNGEFAPSRFYESHVKILELEARISGAGAGSRPAVLVARSDASTDAYALERHHGGGLFSLCRLGAWVDLEALSRHATVLCEQRVPRGGRKAAGEAAEPHPLVTPHLHKENKKKRLAIEALQSMVKKPPRQESVAVADEEHEHVRGELPDLLAGSSQVQDQKNTPLAPLAMPSSKAATASLATALAPDVLDPSAPSNAETIFNNIRSQYFDALYHSMGSLAYFAKGPLSRARAAFHLDCDDTLDMNELIDFLQSLVLPTSLIDKKYRESIPEVISKMKHIVDTSDEKKVSRRKPKKIKLGKDGLYPLEDGHVGAWWASRQPQGSDDEDLSPSSSEGRSLISALRSRETQLQMVLILEVLALEPLRSLGSAESQLPGMDPTAETTQQPPKKKKRARHNFTMLLDVSADRLCIWQSTSLLDGPSNMGESQQQQQQQQQGARANKPLLHNDPLRDFCVDIVVPFFAARLPDVCDAINRKLGGPVIVSPPHKPAAKKAAHSSSTVNPPAQPALAKPGGAATRRPMTCAPAGAGAGRGALQRVLSNDSQHHRRSHSRGPSEAIANLMRSASTAAIPGFKREGSEQPAQALGFAGIPSTGSSSRRGSFASADAASGAALRERSANALLVRSLSAASSAGGNGNEGGSSSGTAADGDAKARRRAHVEAELRDAISALRKPNRQLAGKSMAAEAATRAADGGGGNSLSVIRKARRPQRVVGVGRNNAGAANSSTTLARRGDAVQVKATPANGSRFRDALAAAAVTRGGGGGGGGGGAGAQLDEPPPPSSAVSVIPPSSAPQPGGGGHVNSSGGGAGGGGGGGASRTGALASFVAASPMPAAVAARRSQFLGVPDDATAGAAADLVIPPSSPVVAATPNGKLTAGGARLFSLGRGGAVAAAATTGSRRDALSGFATPRSGFLRPPPAAAESAALCETPVRRSRSAADDILLPSTPVSKPFGRADDGAAEARAAQHRQQAPSTPLPSGRRDGTARGGAPSIFQRLGWDDDFDDLP